MRKEYDFSKARRGAVVRVPKGKTRITIRLDEDVVAWFKEHVHRAGGGNHQSRINLALREHIRQARRALEETLRRILREELRRASWPAAALAPESLSSDSQPSQELSMPAKVPRSRSVRRQPRVAHVHQFLIVLAETDPLVWRRIQVPARYSFWDLHVAIQDAMGWQDYHLHEFTVLDPKSGAMVRIGIPDDEFPDERPCIEGWEVRVSDYFDHAHAKSATYLYDFGDGWEHIVAYEGAQSVDPSFRYPRCISGARACPPEDCGGLHGYVRFLEAIRDPGDPEHGEMLRWIGGSFDPDEFDPKRCHFDDPRRRWEVAFQGPSE